jgi:aryl-alcohol dehydrogenase-like predicted oxidoreductase
MSDHPKHPTRREVMRLGVAAAAGLALARLPLARAAAPSKLELITKPIPSSGERLPVVGLGTNRYGVTEADELAARREVLRRLPELGGTVIDTAPAYGRSEEVIGQLLAEIGNRDKVWIATKVTAPDDDAERGRKMLDESFRRLRTDKVELMQVHSLTGAKVMLPILFEQKQAGRFRYVGVTTSRDEQYDALLEIMRREKLDFVQVDYSIGNRSAAEKVLPLARDRGIAVLVNLPFGGARRNVLATMGERKLPPWAAEVGATSFAQLFLKYAVSHPAVTVAIPGTTKASHLEDNLGAARGRLPDAALRKRIEKYFDAL